MEAVSRTALHKAPQDKCAIPICAFPRIFSSALLDHSVSEGALLRIVNTKQCTRKSEECLNYWINRAKCMWFTEDSKHSRNTR